MRGNNRRLLFSHGREYRLFLSLLEEAHEKYPCAIHHLNLQPNHLHMMTTPSSKELLAKMIQSAAGRYAQRRNWERGGSGKLFEERFFSKVIDNERYLAVCSAYIDLNPVKDGRCNHPGEWKWSTYGFHVQAPELSAISPRLWTPLDWWREMGPENYARWVDDWGTRLRSQEAWHEIELNADEWQEEREIRIRRPDLTRAT